MKNANGNMLRTIKTKAYEVFETQNVLELVHKQPWTVLYAYINSTGYIWFVFRNGPIRYAGRISTELKDWLCGRTLSVHDWSVTGGETIYQQGHATIKKFGLNLQVQIEYENSQA